jgi:RimJ/RimL family protein N-acetyltransferase
VVGVTSGPGSLGGPGAEAATAGQVYEKYAAAIGDAAASKQRHLVLVDDRPVGLIQHCRLDAEPDDPRTIGEHAPRAASIDILVGDVDTVGRGFGAAALDAYVRTVVFADPSVTRAVAGPHPDNTRSCRAFERAGFVAVRDVVIPHLGPERIHVRHRSRNA